LQKPFYKNKEERFIKTFGSLRAFGPLSDPFIKTILSTSSKKGRYKNG
jgi:hypothetical protein